LEKKTILKKKMCPFEKLLFVVRLFSLGSQEGDPFSPPEGEAAQGEYPLDPQSSSFLINLLTAIATLGDARAAGAEARCAVAPKSDSLVPHKNFNRA